MVRYLRHFTAVGDQQTVDWDEEELHVISEELSPAEGQVPTPLTFRESLKKLYSAERFQVCLCGLQGDPELCRNTRLDQPLKPDLCEIISPLILHSFSLSGPSASHSPDFHEAGRHCLLQTKVRSGPLVESAVMS